MLSKKFGYQQLVSCCALTVFSVNVQHVPLMVSVGISSPRRNKLIFIDSIVKINGLYYWNTLLRHIFCQPFVQYLDLSSHFNKTTPWLTMLTRLVALLSAEMPDFIGPQYWPPNSPDLNSVA